MAVTQTQGFEKCKNSISTEEIKKIAEEIFENKVHLSDKDSGKTNLQGVKYLASVVSSHFESRKYSPEDFEQSLNKIVKINLPTYANHAPELYVSGFDNMMGLFVNYNNNTHCVDIKKNEKYKIASKEDALKLYIVLGDRIKEQIENNKAAVIS